MTWWRRLMQRARRGTLNWTRDFASTSNARGRPIARGDGPAEARRRARLAFGGMEQVKEGCRDARGTRWLDDIGRMFATPSHPAPATVLHRRHRLPTLALGGGATTLMFTGDSTVSC